MPVEIYFEYAGNLWLNKARTLIDKWSSDGQRPTGGYTTEFSQIEFYLQQAHGCGADVSGDRERLSRLRSEYSTGSAVPARKGQGGRE